MSVSDGEAAESEVHLAFALHCGYLHPDKHAKLRDQYDHICRQLTKMMDDAASWCGNGCELREISTEYVVEASQREERKTADGSSTFHAPDAPRS